MHLSQLNTAELTDAQITELLYHSTFDDGQQGDCIFVPGAVRLSTIKSQKRFNSIRKDGLINYCFQEVYLGMLPRNQKR